MGKQILDTSEALYTVQKGALSSAHTQPLFTTRIPYSLSNFPSLFWLHRHYSYRLKFCLITYSLSKTIIYNLSYFYSECQALRNKLPLSLKSVASAPHFQSLSMFRNKKQRTQKKISSPTLPMLLLNIYIWDRTISAWILCRESVATCAHCVPVLDTAGLFLNRGLFGGVIKQKMYTCSGISKLNKLLHVSRCFVMKHLSYLKGVRKKTPSILNHNMTCWTWFKNVTEMLFYMGR